ncbi:hypothetical protein HYV74_02305 [Candidatus Uhrbacteria bacterium]|nr:hypothetical protein [Candidatus Uhrbacteria bacterium]
MPKRLRHLLFWSGCGAAVLLVFLLPFCMYAWGRLGGFVDAEYPVGWYGVRLHTIVRCEGPEGARACGWWEPNEVFCIFASDRIRTFHGLTAMQREDRNSEAHYLRAKRRDVLPVLLRWATADPVLVAEGHAEDLALVARCPVPAASSHPHAGREK